MPLRIIYIASASRSGSTILEHTLGSLPSVANCGELRRLQEFYGDRHDLIGDAANLAGCTCKAKVRDCEFWQRVQALSGLNFATARFSSQLGSLNRALFKFSVYVFGPSFTRMLSSAYQPFTRELKVAENCFRVYKAVSNLTNSEYVIDSSKIIHQFLMLRVAYPDEVSLVMLVRDGRDVANSMIRGERKRYFMQGKYAHASGKVAFKAAARSWMATNLQILLCYFRVPMRQRHFIRYEDLCQEPERELGKLTAQLEINPVAQREPASWIASEHAIGGSPARFYAGFDSIRVSPYANSQTARAGESRLGIFAGLINKMLGYQ